MHRIAKRLNKIKKRRKKRGMCSPRQHIVNVDYVTETYATRKKGIEKVSLMSVPLWEEKKLNEDAVKLFIVCSFKFNARCLRNYIQISMQSIFSLLIYQSPPWYIDYEKKIHKTFIKHFMHRVNVHPVQYTLNDHQKLHAVRVFI